MVCEHFSLPIPLPSLPSLSSLHSSLPSSFSVLFLPSSPPLLPRLPLSSPFYPLSNLPPPPHTQRTSELAFTRGFTAPQMKSQANEKLNETLFTKSCVKSTEGSPSHTHLGENPLNPTEVTPCERLPLFKVLFCRDL